MTYEIHEGGYLVSTDPSLLEIDRIHAFLRKSYWAEGVPRDVVARSTENSIPFGLYDADHQVGFARAITDRTTFAYVADVYVETEHQRRGLGKLQMRAVMAHPDLQGLRRWMLATNDAHGLCRQCGFSELGHPQRWMEKHDRNVYKRAQA